MGSGGGCRSRARSPSRTLAVADADAVPHGEGPGRAAKPSRLRDLDPKKIGGGARRYGGARGDPSSPLFCARPGGGCRAAGPAYPDTGRGAPPNCPALCPPAPPPLAPPCPPPLCHYRPIASCSRTRRRKRKKAVGKKGGTAGSCLVLLVAVGRFFKQSCRRAPASRGGDGLGRPCVSTMGIRTADVAVVGGMTSPRTGSPSVRPRWAAPPSRPASRAGPGRGHPPPPQQPA